MRTSIFVINQSGFRVIHLHDFIHLVDTWFRKGWKVCIIVYNLSYLVAKLVVICDRAEDPDAYRVGRQKDTS